MVKKNNKNTLNMTCFCGKKGKPFEIKDVSDFTRSGVIGDKLSGISKIKRREFNGCKCSVYVGTRAGRKKMNINTISILDRKALKKLAVERAKPRFYKGKVNVARAGSIGLVYPQDIF